MSFGDRVRTRIWDLSWADQERKRWKSNYANKCEYRYELLSDSDSLLAWLLDWGKLLQPYHHKSLFLVLDGNSSALFYRCT